MLLIHRCLIFSSSFAVTCVFCSQGMGICRPQPLLFYLKNSTPEYKFQRDPFSLSIILFIVTFVLVLQVLIELKKNKLRINARNAEKAAQKASRNLQEARLKLNQKNNTGQSSNSGPLESSNPEDVMADSEAAENRNNALKFARAVALFALLPESLFGILLSLESIQDWRPHGVTIALMLIAGTIIPAVMFIGNAKLRKFLVQYVRNIFLQHSFIFRAPRVVPMINIDP